MKNFIAVTFPESGFTYELPMNKVAGCLALAYQQAHPEIGVEDDISAHVAKVCEDPAALAEMARHMLAWPDLRGGARLVDCQHRRAPALALAEWSQPYDEPRVAILPESENQGLSPLDLHLSVMWQTGAKVSAQVFHDGAGVVAGAMIFVGGDKEQVDAYLSVCAQLCVQLTEHPEGAAVPVRRPFKH